MSATAYAITAENGDTLTVHVRTTAATWNGYPVPVLTETQAAAVGALIGETLHAGPADGLTWCPVPVPDSAGEDVFTCGRCGDECLYWQHDAHAAACGVSACPACASGAPCLCASLTPSGGR